MPEVLGKGKANQNSKTSKGDQPNPKLRGWFLVASQGDYKVFVKSVTARYVDVRDADFYLQSALMKAARSGNIEIVDELVNRGANVNASAGFAVVERCGRNTPKSRTTCPRTPPRTTEEKIRTVSDAAPCCLREIMKQTGEQPPRAGCGKSACPVR